MTLRHTLTAACVAIGTALPVQALDLSSLDDAERDALRAEIRAYLLENPEVIMEAVAVLEERQAAGEAAADVELVRANAEALFAAPGDWVGGNTQGDITLVEFMDYRCGYCRRAAEEVAGLLAADGNIRLVLKEFPILGEDSTAASRFAIATKQVAGDEAYKSVHDALMTYNGAMNTVGFTRLADALGLDANAIVAGMESEAVTGIIAANHALAQRLRINGTPAFVMGEQMLRGFLPQDQMQAIADEIRTN